MAFHKHANAALVNPGIDFDAWAGLKRLGGQDNTFTERTAAKVVLQEFDPKQYLLSHVTIMASVDTDESNQPLGRHIVDGVEIDRRYSDYYITPKTSAFVNNNFDAWERRLLLSTYKSFIGAQSYLEHIQLPELSKGRIIDAAARDTGASVYIDILVATDRKHKPLIEAITSGQLQTLSMGCTVSATQCTKCGNVAEDETQLCTHIKYMKGNTFFDAAGVQRKVAELCGHRSDPKSVSFIEASWVANPAFTGAVLRNILSPEDVEKAGQRIQVAFTSPTPVVDPSFIQKAAHKVQAQFGQEEFPGGNQGTPAAEPSKPEDTLSKAVDSVADQIRDKALEKVRGDLGKEEMADRPSENRNDTIIKEALKHPQWRRIAHVLLSQTKDPKIARRMLLGMALYRSGGWKAVQASKSLSGRDILALARLSEMSIRKATRAGTNRIYKTILAVGGINQYADQKTFLAACRREIGREITDSEKTDLLVKGYLYSLGS